MCVEKYHIKLGHFYFHFSECFLASRKFFHNLLHEPYFKFVSQAIYSWHSVNVPSNHSLCISHFWDRKDHIQKPEYCSKIFCHSGTEVLSMQSTLVYDWKTFANGYKYKRLHKYEKIVIWLVHVLWKALRILNLCSFLISLHDNYLKKFRKYSHDIAVLAYFIVLVSVGSLKSILFHYFRNCITCGKSLLDMECTYYLQIFKKNICSDNCLSGSHDFCIRYT